MIVAIGHLGARPDEAGRPMPAGFLASLAMAAAEAGAPVQVVARIGDDDIGDAVLLALATSGVGHVATLRDAGYRTPLLDDVEGESPGDDPEPMTGRIDVDGGATLEPADVALALRYLTDYRVIVVVHVVGADLIREAAAAAGWGGAHLIVVAPPDTEVDLEAVDGALILAADPRSEGIATRLGRYAAAVDRGTDLDTAYAVLTEATTSS